MNNTYASSAQGRELRGILDAISIFGCLSKEQAIQFMPETPYNREEKFKKILNNLKYTQAVKVDGDYVLAPQTTLNFDIIDSVWLMLELHEKYAEDKAPVSDLLGSVRAGNAIETVEFILNKSKIAHIVPLFIDSHITNALFLQDKYLANGHSADEKNPTDIYYFMCRNTEMVEAFTKAHIKLPHGIAFLEGEPGKKPEIKLYTMDK